MSKTKRINPYAVFLWIMLGIPGICLGALLLGSLGLMMYYDTVGPELNWFALFVMVVFIGPVCLAVPVGIMGGFQNSGESAEGFVKGWGMFILATIVIFVLPALGLLAANQYGVVDFIKTVFA